MPVRKRTARLLSSRFYLISILILLFLLDAFTLWYTSQRDYERTVERAQLVLQKTAISLEERIKRTIVATEAILANRAERIGETGIEGTVSSANERERFQGAARELPDAGSLWLLDSRGDLVLDSTQYPSRPDNFRDREYFGLQRDRGDPVHIGPLVKGRITGKYSFTISHRINGKEGRFLGIVLAAIDTDDFTDFLRNIDIGRDSSVAVFRTDGALILRQPMKKELIGKNLSNLTVFTEPFNRSPSGLFKSSAIDGTPRFLAYRKVPDLPLLVVTGVPVESVLKEWRGRLKMNSLLAASIFLALLGLSLVVHRTTLREERERAGELASINESLQSEIVERKMAEEALRKAHDELEMRVKERTSELEQAYVSLRRETEERERTQEALRQSHKMEALGTMAGGIAHDFNNILAAILGFTEMAQEDVQDRPDVHHNLGNVVRSAMRARELVKQILAFARKTTYERGPLSLSEIIKETIQLMRASIPAMVEIKFSITATSDRVFASPVEVQQILINLVNNAWLAMEEKGGTLEVKLSDIDFEGDINMPGTYAAPGEYVQLVVTDTGVGMGPEVMKRLFDPFFTTREVGKGTGMGLSVVYGIIKDLNGTIAVESVPGEGSTFRVMLPKAKTGADAKTVAIPEIIGGTEKILFVDDERMIAEWGRKTLERLGYKVTAVTDSEEGLNIFSSDPALFDLVITDYAMPRIAGPQLAAELLAVRKDIPIILCTGYSQTISPDTARRIGIREFLSKPLVKQELASSVRRVLDHRDT